MNLFGKVKSFFGVAPDHAPAAEPFLPEQFIYIKIPGNIGPLDRGELFEDKIDPVLAQDDLGSVSGGGSSLGDEREDGSRVVVFCGIDIDTRDRDQALIVLRGLLPQLNAPAGTELQYTKDGVKMQDDYLGDQWTLAQQRNDVHPGFGV